MCCILWVVLAVSSSKLLHQSINLLGLPRKTKLGQKVTQGLHKLHVTKFHLVNVGIHHTFAVAVCVGGGRGGGWEGDTNTLIAMEGEEEERGGERREGERREGERREGEWGEGWGREGRLSHTHTHTHSLISLPQVVSDSGPIQPHVTVKESGNFLWWPAN